MPSSALSAPPASCQSAQHCHHPVCFAAHLTRPCQHGIQTVLACALHLADTVQALTGQAVTEGGLITVAAVSPSSWPAADLASPLAGPITAGLTFGTVQVPASAQPLSGRSRRDATRGHDPAAAAHRNRPGPRKSPATGRPCLPSPARTAFPGDGIRGVA